MKIQKYNTIQDIPIKGKNACAAGKWNQWRRVFIVEVGAQYQVFSLNLIQRFAAGFLKLFQFNYFKSILGGKEFKFLGPKDLNPTARRVAQLAPQQPSILIPEPPAVPPATQPNSVRPVPAPLTIQDISQENRREFDRIYSNYAFDHMRVEIRAFMRDLCRQDPRKLQELEIYLNWKLPAGPQTLPNIPGLTREEIRKFVCYHEYAATRGPNYDIPQDMRDRYSNWDPDTRNKLEIYLNNRFPHLAPQPAVAAPQIAPIPAPPAARPVTARPIIPGLSPEEIEEFETSYETHAAAGLNDPQHMRVTYHVFTPEKRAKLETYLNWKAAQSAAPQSPAAVNATDLADLPQNARPLRFIMAPNELTQYNRDGGDRFKSSCALMAAAYLTGNEQASPKSVEDAIRSPQNPTDEGLELDDNLVLQYRHKGNRLEAVPPFQGAPVPHHTLQHGDLRQFLQNNFNQLFNATKGCLITYNSKTYCIRQKSANLGVIEFFDSHGYSQLCGNHGGFVAEFRNLEHLKSFLSNFKPFSPIPGGAAGFGLLFAKIVKA